MYKVLLIATLVCKPGDQFVDWSESIPSTAKTLDLVITVEPFYSRFYIYPVGHAENIQPCCGNKRTSIIEVLAESRRFGIRQSQPNMKWSVRVMLKPSTGI